MDDCSAHTIPLELPSSTGTTFVLITPEVSVEVQEKVTGVYFDKGRQERVGIWPRASVKLVRGTGGVDTYVPNREHVHLVMGLDQRAQRIIQDQPTVFHALLVKYGYTEEEVEAITNDPPNNSMFPSLS